MNTSDFTTKNDFFSIKDRQIDSLYKYGDEFIDPSAGKVYNTMASSPLGRLLGIISTLPEIRQEKVLSVRRQINSGQYNITDNLDLALDMVLEEFIAD
ncbi:MAG: flagellar biosynthesis anti-sigma factor FlgM [Sedimentisphaerales bacterium]|nr:flagellar biosynthesis anti-sigma factor FlgM [Sedimentisphaerales bacterium]